MTAIRASLMLLTLLASGVAHALPFDGAPRASDEELDSMRGGFIVNLNGQDFLMAFSIDRLTYVNGELVSSITLNPLALTPLSTLQVKAGSPPVQTASGAGAIPDSPVTATPSAGQPGASAAGTPVVVSNPTVSTQVTTQNGVTLVQNGLGNTIALPANVSLNSLATIVQNTLNNQVISNITVMNATIAARALAAQAQLNAVINQSFRGLN